MISPGRRSRLLVQPPRLRADVEQADVRGVVDEERRRRRTRRRRAATRFDHLVVEAALAQVVALDRRLRRDEALRELGLGHLQAEQRDRPRAVLASATFSAMFVTSADLPIDGSRGQDDQVAGLEAAGDRVEVGEAGGRAGQRVALGRAPATCGSRRRGRRRPCGSPSGGRRGRPRGPRARRARRGRAAAPRGRGRWPGSRRTPSSRRRRSARSRTIGAYWRRLPTDGTAAVERVDLGLAAGLVELAARAEVLDDGDDVDRLAVVKRESMVS